ncbi:MAG: class I SAM-dependent methyltransferase [Gaiellaceae bacterium]
MNVLEQIHERHLFGRRTRVLAELVAGQLPRQGRILDIGTGDGTIASLVAELRPELELTGIDVQARQRTAIPVQRFDGLSIPFQDSSFGACLLIDVLHHAEDPLQLLREAARVAPVVVVKDHLADGVLARPILRLMDRVGNARHGVDLPYAYWCRSEWLRETTRAGLLESEMSTEVPLYPVPLSWIFGRRLQFIARFVREES